MSATPTPAMAAAASTLAADAGWAEETALDVEWAHAIAPGANIVLIECNSPSGLYAGVAAANTLANRTNADKLGVPPVSVGPDFNGCIEYHFSWALRCSGKARLKSVL